MFDYLLKEISVAWLRSLIQRSKANLSRTLRSRNLICTVFLASLSFYHHFSKFLFCYSIYILFIFCVYFIFAAIHKSGVFFLCYAVGCCYLFVLFVFGFCFVLSSKLFFVCLFVCFSFSLACFCFCSFVMFCKGVALRAVRLLVFVTPLPSLSLCVIFDILIEINDNYLIVSTILWFKLPHLLSPGKLS